jgi:PAS domain S-box-containing protein
MVHGPGVAVSQSRQIDRACLALETLHRLVASEGQGKPITARVLQAAIDRCTTPMMVLDAGARIVLVNGLAARLVGYSTRELQQLTMWDVTHASYQSDFEVLWREFLRAGRQRGRYGLAHRDGSLVEVTYCGEVKAPTRLATVALHPLS